MESHKSFILLLTFIITVAGSVIFEDCEAISLTDIALAEYNIYDCSFPGRHPRKKNYLRYNSGSAYELHRVSIHGCGMRLPCFITLGEKVPVTMKFYSEFESNKLDQDVIININFISLRTFVTPDPCATVNCPVKSDSYTSFTSIMTVPTNVAVSQRGFLQWRVYNDENRLLLCYSVLVQTESPFQKFFRRSSMRYYNMTSEENEISVVNESNSKIMEKLLHD